MSAFVEFNQDPVGHVTQLLLPGVILGIAAGAALMRLTARHVPVIQGVNLVVVSLIVLINLGVDTLYAVLDPGYVISRRGERRRSACTR